MEEKTLTLAQEAEIKKKAAALDISLPLLRECDHEGTLPFGKKALCQQRQQCHVPRGV